MPKTTISKPTPKPAAPRAARSVKPVQQASGRRLPRFLREVRVEMGKVTWPTRTELIAATSVVIVAVVIAASYIGVLDLIWSTLINLVKLG